ncbi:hypothetical protein AAJ76_3000113883 [Vairimorpha ceranae]|uniref:Uncharacterized protein n=1 Tax=Vairimorpha ceranae TaxID=40302 RepID=A0A0F9ZGR3_9MICR|nr:hypothetical protein AAJ76_3000113883 [Vairimorpha ceranae]KKO76454.1 hypothetical protein AAJ76_3000113883 [Vairimorpha ceranae]
MMNQGSHYNKISSTSTESYFNEKTLRKQILRSILECFLATGTIPGKHASLVCHTFNVLHIICSIYK